VAACRLRFGTDPRGRLWRWRRFGSPAFRGHHALRGMADLSDGCIRPALKTFDAGIVHDRGIGLDAALERQFVFRGTSSEPSLIFRRAREPHRATNFACPLSCLRRRFFSSGSGVAAAAIRRCDVRSAVGSNALAGKGLGRPPGPPVPKSQAEMSEIR